MSNNPTLPVKIDRVLEDFAEGMMAYCASLDPGEDVSDEGITAVAVKHKTALLEAFRAAMLEDVIGENVRESDYELNMGVPNNPPSNTTRTNLYRQGVNNTKDECRHRLNQILGESNE